MLHSEYTTSLTDEIKIILSEWKRLDETDTILAYTFAALVQGELINNDYNYRTFHAAMREKFPKYHINIGYDWAEAIYNAIITKDLDYNVSISEDQIKRCRKYATDIKLRLLSAINPNIK